VVPVQTSVAPLRVVWVSHSAQLGGAELSLAESLGPLADRGHAVHVVIPREGPLRQRLQDAAGVHVCWHNRWATQPPPMPVRDRLRHGAFNLFMASRRVANIARAVNADLIVSNTIVGPTGAFAAKWSGRPHVWFLHEQAQELLFHFGRRSSYALMRSLTDLFLVNSETLRAHFARWFPPERLRRVHLAVDVPPLALGRRDASDGACRVVLVGRRRPSKGQQDAVAAVGRLTSAGVNVALELVGPGDPAFDEELRTLAVTCGAQGRISFVGPEEDHFAHFAGADISLTCSRIEALGRTTIEAMKLGKPVIGAAAGATPELVRPGWNGLLYEPGDAADLARSVEALASDPTAARAMGDRARAWAWQTFNREVLACELESAFTSVRRPRAERVA
jgi:glycosyltransferase involved in cell wall biosynthesis